MLQDTERCMMTLSPPPRCTYLSRSPPHRAHAPRPGARCPRPRPQRRRGALTPLTVRLYITGWPFCKPPRPTPRHDQPSVTLNATLCSPTAILQSYVLRPPLSPPCPPPARHRTVHSLAKPPAPPSLSGRRAALASAAALTSRPRWPRWAAAPSERGSLAPRATAAPG